MFRKSKEPLTAEEVQATATIIDELPAFIDIHEVWVESGRRDPTSITLEWRTDVFDHRYTKFVDLNWPDGPTEYAQVSGGVATHPDEPAIARGEVEIILSEEGVEDLLPC